MAQITCTYHSSDAKKPCLITGVPRLGALLLRTCFEGGLQILSRQLGAAGVSRFWALRSCHSIPGAVIARHSQTPTWEHKPLLIFVKLRYSVNTFSAVQASGQVSTLFLYRRDFPLTCMCVCVFLFSGSFCLLRIQCFSSCQLLCKKSGHGQAYLMRV